MAHQSINLHDGKLLASFEHMSPAQLEQALTAARGVSMIIPG